jgi:glycosyltransferase involved in cell wall biosynthesis
MKPALLYLSPFLPQRSGISDYSEILIYGLRHYFDITIVTDDYSLENKKLYDDFRVINHSKSDISFDAFPLRLYNIGNNPYLHSYIYDAAVKFPGFVILHDYILYFLAVGYFQKFGSLYSKLYELGGAEAISLLKPFIKSRVNLLACKEVAAKLPLNQEILQRALGVLVHSRYTHDKLCTEFPGVNVRIIPMVSMGEAALPRGDDYLNTAYGIPADAFVVASFGFIAETKLNHKVSQAVASLNEQLPHKIYYLMVGEGSSADDCLSPFIVKTGYVEKNLYNAILSRCNLVANLRYPTMGETSFSLIHAMSMGKPCMVTDDAWFAELPDSVVVKVPIHNFDHTLRASIMTLLNNPEALQKTGSNAREYVKKEHSLSDISRSIYQFLTDH